MREATAQLLDHGKKVEVVTEAERLLKGSGWLPEVLHRRDLVVIDGAEWQGSSEPVSDTEQVEDVELPSIQIADLPSDQA